MAEVKQGNEDPSEITKNIQKTLANVGHSVLKDGKQVEGKEASLAVIGERVSEFFSVRSKIYKALKLY